MKTQFNFYEAATAVGSEKCIKGLLSSIAEKDYDDYVIVRKSQRRWAAFHGSGVNLVPDWEPTSSVEEFLAL